MYQNEEKIREELLKRAGEFDSLEKEKDFRDKIKYEQRITDVTGSLGIWGITQE